MNNSRQIEGPTGQLHLFDTDGLPWSAHLSVGWILFVVLVTGGLEVIPVALYLGVWLRAKTGSLIVLVLYALFTASMAVLFFSGSMNGLALVDIAALLALVLWLSGALIARNQISRHYARCEGCHFSLNLPLTLLFGPWYLNYRLRPEFPRSRPN
jgi:hypothetical protein